LQEPNFFMKQSNQPLVTAAAIAMSATMQSAVIATARSQNIKHRRKQSHGGDTILALKNKKSFLTW